MYKIPERQILSGYAITMESNGKCLINSVDDEQISLPYCLPGELVAYAKVTYARKNFNYYEHIIKPSEERIQPACAHFTQCGGCLLQQCSTNFYNEFKINVLNSALRQYNINEYNVVQPIRVVPPASRRRANLEAHKKTDKLFMGFHKLQSHQINDMHECPVLTVGLQNSIPYWRAMCDLILVDGQKAKIFALDNNGNIDIGLEIQGIQSLNDQQIADLKEIAVAANWHRLQFKFRKHKQLIVGPEIITMSFGNLNVEMNAWAFCQASLLAQNWLQQLLIENLEQHHKIGEALLDLFCGRGTFTGPMLKFGNVVALEGDKLAIEELTKAFNTFQVSNPDSTGYSLDAQQRDLFSDPLTIDELNQYSTVVIDPPRAGASAQIQLLARSKVKLVCYVSCNPESFARDARCLIDGGYTLSTCYPIDQFLWSNHLEVFAVFTK